MKILASDYDGTLNRKGTISKEDINAVNNWRKAGNLFGLVTGRGFLGASHEMNHYSLDYDFLICNNGSVIYNSKGECLSAVTGDNTALKPLIKYIMDFNGERAAISGINLRLMVNINDSEELNTYEKWIEFHEIDKIPFSFTQVDTNARTDDNAEKLSQFINSKLKHYVFARQNGINVDINPAGVNKAEGIYRLMEIFNIDKKNTLVVGDNFNDLEMILEFNGYAISSGNPAVITKASKIYNTIEELINDNI